MLAIDQQDAFPHKDITEAIIGAAFEAYNDLGYGYLHRVYQNSLQVELNRRGRRHQLEKRINVNYKDVPVGYYDVDIIVDEAVIVEVKIAAQYDKRDEAPLLNLLRPSGLKLGVLVNFGRHKVAYRRLIF
ncbi:MAG TPA: GxxExxY protein [Chthoniobacterales bacterium]|nr:GxxExxY protein [Chthoniobacterales bacterium]